MRVHWLWLDMLKKLTVAQKLTLLSYFGDPESIYNADARTLRGIGYLTPEMQEQLLNKDMDKAYKRLADCEGEGIGFITYTDSNFPSRMRSLDDAPLILYYKGRLPDFESKPLIGVVGTRYASSRGLNAARTLGGQIAACGGIVVSGGAVGIDIQALVGANEAGMPTVTLLAGGLDRLYPKENESTFNTLCKNGCLLSEYPPGSISYKGNFLRRNRLISGMSNGILVVEAPEKSGALNTARWASKQGKDLFAVPGPVNMPECAGSNELLEDGARAAVSGWAVLQVYAQRYSRTVRQAEFVPKSEVRRQRSDKKDVDKGGTNAYSVIEKTLPAMNEQERMIAQQLCSGPQPTYDLASALDMDTSQLMRLLTVMTMNGIVEINGSEVKLK